MTSYVDWSPGYEPARTAEEQAVDQWLTALGLPNPDECDQYDAR